MPPALSPTDRDPVAGDTELFGTIDRIDVAGEHVLEGRREPRLPREPVIEREHLDPGGLGEVGAGAVVGLDRADLPAAAVDKDRQAGVIGQPGGLIESRPAHLALAASHGQVPAAGVLEMGERGGPLQALEESRLGAAGGIGERGQFAPRRLGEELQARAQSLPVNPRAPARQRHEGGVRKREEPVRGAFGQTGAAGAHPVLAETRARRVVQRKDAGLRSARPPGLTARTANT